MDLADDLTAFERFCSDVRRLYSPKRITDVELNK
jgi:hypothetical protein